jgi:hypothetical protein
MAAKVHRNPALVVHPDRPLLGVIDVEDGQEVVHYFVSDTDAEEEVASRIVAEARALAGAWSDRDWEEAVETFDRLRHDSEPTPPIDAL